MAASLPTLFSPRWTRGSWIFLAGSVLIPLLVLIPPRPAQFAASEFAVSYLHWLLITAFFFFSLGLRARPEDLRLLVTANVVAGVFVALFAVYQVVGIPRSWPATGARLFTFQREPFRFTWIGGTYQGGGYIRPTSLFLEPAWLGGYLAWTLALAFVVGRDRRRGVGVLARIVAVALPLVAILATVSWGAYCDLAVVLFASLAGLARSGTLGARAARKVGLGAAGMSILLLLSPPGRWVREAAVERWSMLTETSLSAPEMSEQVLDSSWVRLRNAEHTLALFRTRPLSGIGLGQFHRYAAMAPSNPLRDLVYRDPWLGWLSIAAEAGLFGPLLLIGALALVARRRAGLAESGLGSAVPVLVLLAVVQQCHTGSYIDLWWWYPLSLGALLGGSRNENSAATE